MTPARRSTRRSPNTWRSVMRSSIADIKPSCGIDSKYEAMSASCHPPPPPLVLIEDQLQGIVRRSVRAEPERARQKPRLEDRLNDDLHCGLHDPVAHRGDRQRPPLTAAGLRDVDPAGRKRTVAAVPKPTPKIIEQHAHPGLLDVGDGGPVDARGTAVAAHLPPRPLQDVSAKRPCQRARGSVCWGRPWPPGRAFVAVSRQGCWQGRKVGFLRRELHDGTTVCDTD